MSPVKVGSLERWPSTRHYDSCTFCNISKVAHLLGTWWHLSNYRGHTGHACPTCYDRISTLTEDEGKKYAAVVNAITRRL